MSCGRPSCQSLLEVLVAPAQAGTTTRAPTAVPTSGVLAQVGDHPHRLGNDGPGLTLSGGGPRPPPLPRQLTAHLRRLLTASVTDGRVSGYQKLRWKEGKAAHKKQV
jgi:hypothetical protein